MSLCNPARNDAALAVPILARVLPFMLFIALLVLDPLLARGIAAFGGDARWSYAIRAIAATVALIAFARSYVELRPGSMPGAREAAFAAASGLVVFVMWIALATPPFVFEALRTGFNARSGDGGLAIALVALRVAGAVLVVPVIEELFWRSFLLRWLERQDFLRVAPATASLRAILMTSVVFGLEHNEWLAGMLAGAAYALLYARSGRLWVPVIAHATTNAALAAWVIATGSWHLW